ncbi:PIN domain-containing protein [Chromobacterium violaceum]|uniref:PIN domain-containing protein n=1 Tax=Chromobacterium violaceum TaxID=536 RepID=UPI0015FC69A1|nr:PIN domain-containing protein [Chromobacterium violaceum]MBA8734192.1 DUF4935 domain-containing protein [Chromobacterium violaceum]
MQNNFFEYFRPTREETEALWKEAHFIFDTNVLLNLYRMSAETSREMREILRKIESRLFLPHQVGMEFFRHVEEEIAKQVNEFESVKNRLKKIPNDFGKELTRHPCIPINAIKEALEKCINEQIEAVEKSQSDNQINFLEHEDPILSELNSLFKDSSAGASSAEEEKEINEKIELRIKENSAPCYTSISAKKNLENNPHRGDGRVWFQILKYASEKKKPIIFITGDLKENWWRMVKLGNSEKPVGPHVALIRDITSITENKFWMYTQTEFLEMAPKYLGAREQTKGIEEVKHISEILNQSLSSEVPDEPMKRVIKLDYASKLVAKTEALIDDQDDYCQGETAAGFPEEFESGQGPEIDGEEK